MSENVSTKSAEGKWMLLLIVRSYIWFALALLPVDARAIGGTQQRNSRNLLCNSRIVADISDWNEGASTTTFYRWMSDRKVLYVRAIEGRWHFFVLDTKTKVQVPMDQFNKLFEEILSKTKLPVDNFHWRYGGLPTVFAFEPSPDGKKFLWSTYDAKCYTCKWNGTNLRDWPAVNWEPKRLFWLNDSRTWVYASNRPLTCEPGKHLSTAVADVYFHDTGAPRSREKRIGNINWPHGEWAIGGNTLAVKLSTVQFSVGPHAQASVTVIKLLSEKHSRRNYMFHLPPHQSWERFEVVLNPQCTRIAWLFDDKVGKRNFVDLLICNIDGTGMYDFGHVEVTGMSPERTGPRNLRWTPDSKCVSYVFRRKLWKVELAQHTHRAQR